MLFITGIMYTHAAIMYGIKNFVYLRKDDFCDLFRSKTKCISLSKDIKRFSAQIAQELQHTKKAKQSSKASAMFVTCKTIKSHQGVTQTRPQPTPRPYPIPHLVFACALLINIQLVLLKLTLTSDICDMMLIDFTSVQKLVISNLHAHCFPLYQ